MKRMYRSIAVTVLAALMALPMVVRAEDTRKKITKIYVEGLSSQQDVKLYVGEKPSDVLERYGKYTFKAELPSGGSADVKLRSAKFYTDENMQNESQEKIVWPFKKSANGLEYEASKTNFYVGFELVLKDEELYKTYQFDNPQLFFGQDKRQSLQSKLTSRDEQNTLIYRAFFPFKCDVYRKVKFANYDITNNPVKFGQRGEAVDKPEMDLELKLSTNQTVDSLLRKKGDNTRENAQVEYQYDSNVYKKLAFWHSAGQGYIEPVNLDKVNVTTYGLNLNSKENDLWILARCTKLDEKVPFMKAQDVTLDLDKKITTDKLIKKAITILTKDAYVKIGVDELELKKVKAYVTYPNQGKREFNVSDIDKVKEDGIEMTYEYKDGDGPNQLVLESSAKLFVKKPQPQPPIPAPQPPVPAPQPPVPAPQPKQQEKTGNAYFDLGRYNLPTCPDSKNNQCAEAGSGAKKDDVPNTAAAAIN